MLASTSRTIVWQSSCHGYHYEHVLTPSQILPSRPTVLSRTSSREYPSANGPESILTHTRFDDFVRGDKETQEKVFNQWNINGTGPLATNGIEAGVKVRPTEKELDEMDSWPYPEFRSGWDNYFKDKPDKP